MSIKKKGMTLIEVLVGFTILLIGATSILAFFIFFTKMNVVILGNMQSKYIAEKFSERIRAVSYRSSLILNDGDNKVFAMDWNIIEDSPMSGMKTIKVRIMWNQIDEKRKFEFTTLKGSG